MEKWKLVSLILVLIIIVETIAFVLLYKPAPAPAALPPPPTRYDQISQADLVRYALQEGVALSYGMPPGWAHYGIAWKTFTELYGIQHSDTDMGSAVVVATLEAAKGHPDADVADLAIPYAIKAAQENLTDCYIPPHFDAVPAVFKDPNGCWIAPYYGTIAFVVNVDYLKARGVPIPKSWKDLLNPVYKGMIVYQDPTKTATGLITIIAAAYANGGDINNWRPGLDFIKKLHEIGNIKYVPPLVPTADYQKGEVPILINFDYNGLTYKYSPGFPNTEVIIPEDGTVSRAGAMIIARGGPHPFAARLFFNFIMSDLGSLLITLAFAKPSRTDYTPPAFIQQLFPPAQAYAKAVPIDERALSKVLQDVSNAWQSEVLPIASAIMPGFKASLGDPLEKDPSLKINPYLLQKALPLIEEYVKNMKVAGSANTALPGLLVNTGLMLPAVSLILLDVEKLGKLV
ncbi:extracellular solute-binding protein [Thermogladius sp.]|uniref:extracellular solute-binding protein n=1 Tax=Thermogladius sp. TaxID=2023064 RepID=UPI003D13896C